MLKRLLFVGAAMGATAFATAAFAQQAAQQAVRQPAQLDELVVTAQRRSESLQDVPLSVTAATAEQLQTAGVQNTQELTQLVPGLVFSRSTIATQPTIRGIGSRSGSTGNEANVAIYLDGVYQGQPFANLFDLNDVEQIEVLKGPQVTLYGRNATGGSINIRTRRPSFQPTGDVSASYGSFDYRKGSVYVSGPLAGDTLAGSLSIAGAEDDGYIDNVFLNTTEGKQWMWYVRPKLLYAPNERFEVELSGLYLQSNITDNYSSHALGGNTSARTAANPGGIPLDIIIPEGGYVTSGSFEPLGKIRSASADLRASYDFGGAVLSGLVGYKRTYGVQLRDADHTPLPILAVQINPFSRSWYGELVLTSPSDQRLTWLAGVTGYSDLTETRPQIINGVSKSYYGVHTRALSAFAEATYEAIDNLFITAGVRVSSEEKKAFNTVVNSADIVTAQTTGQDDWKDATPRLVARYEINPRTNVYVSYSEGFKSGSFDASSGAGAENSVDPETVKAYEAGVKMMLTSRLRLNGAVFRYDYGDLQVAATTSGAGFSFSRLQNAADARIYGAEVDTMLQATDHLRVGLSVSYLDTEFRSFPSATVANPRFVNGLPAGNQNSVQDLAGFELVRSPELTVNLSAEYSIEAFGGMLDLNANLYRSSKFFFDVNNRTYQPAYSILNATVTWRDLDSGLYLRLQGRNLTDEEVYSHIFPSGNGDVSTFQKPRNWLATIGYEF